MWNSTENVVYLYLRDKIIKQIIQDKNGYAILKFKKPTTTTKISLLLYKYKESMFTCSCLLYQSTLHKHFT